jgi:hypothetical protein
MLTYTWSIHLTAFTIIHIFTYRVFLVWCLWAWYLYCAGVHHTDFQLQQPNSETRSTQHTAFKLRVSLSVKEQCLPRHTWTQFSYCTRNPSHSVTDNTRISHAKQRCTNNLTLHRAVAISFSTFLNKGRKKEAHTAGLRFLYRRSLGLKPSGMLRSLVGRVVSCVSKDPSAFIFRTKQRQTGLLEP